MRDSSHLNENEALTEATPSAPEAAPKKPRGFAAISPERRREIASKGGKSAHAIGTAHRFTADEARAAGKKGGAAPHVRRGRGPLKEVAS